MQIAGILSGRYEIVHVTLACVLLQNALLTENVSKKIEAEGASKEGQQTRVYALFRLGGTMQSETQRSVVVNENKVDRSKQQARQSYQCTQSPVGE